MATSLTTIASRVARAVRFYNEPELFIGAGVSQPWPDDSNPPTPVDSSFNVGWISNQAYSGSSLSNLNCTVALTQAPLLTSRTLVLTVLSASTYQVTSGGTVVGPTTNTAGPSPNTAVDPGLSLLVTSTAMTPGDTFTFTADGINVGFKKCSQVNLVVPDVNGTIAYRDQNWRIVDPADALSQGARWVYVATSFIYDELPVNVTYRQLGVFSGLQRAEGVSTSQGTLLPNQVASVGTVEVLENRSPTTRDISQQATIRFIIPH